jgi:predicted nucleic acid-binding protein
MALPFLDTNVLLRHLLQDHPQQSPRSTAYLARVERGEIKVRTADTVVFETVFTLQRQYGVSKADIRDNLLPLLELPGIVLPGKRRLRKVFDLYVDLNLPFADAYHVALMQRLGLRHVISFDKEFNRVPGVTRVEPGEDG